MPAARSYVVPAAAVTPAYEAATVGETAADTETPFSAPVANSQPAAVEQAARTSLAYHPPSFAAPPDFRAMMGRLMLGTALVLAVCVGSLWAGKRYVLGGGSNLANSQRRIRVLDTVPVGPRAKVQLVQVDQKKVLVGFDSNGLKAMVPINEPFETALHEAELSYGAELKASTSR